MLSAAQLRKQIGAYASGRISLGEFEDWFYECSDEVEAPVEEVVASIDAALSAIHFGGLRQPQLRMTLEELATALLPFAQSQVMILASSSLEKALEYKIAPSEGRSSVVPVERMPVGSAWGIHSSRLGIRVERVGSVVVLPA